MKTAKLALILFVLVLLIICLCSAQENVFMPDLSKIVKNDGWKVVNRNVSLLMVDGKPAAYLDGRAGDGVVWLEGFEFNNGTIEVDIKGKDEQGSSFVGIAFRGVDEKTYDAVYFRPFNFLSKDSVRKSHGVQYISYPVYTWEKLREEFPGKYENRVSNVSDPNLFFHARIVVQRPKITVFVNSSEEPSLVVEELSGRTSGWVGIWTGNYSDGTFTKFKITKKD